ncbi:hypothetical protein QFZ94_004992 [Paraburkholderia sp. JPY465]|uniref:hypothetical protein n=1 Tax=Paraburkholderia sp. JPY465 TaxID=3042285 RepID=UPI003D233B24
MFKNRAFVASALAVLVLSACAPAIPVQRTEFTSFTTARQQQRFRIAMPVALQLTTGYSRQLKEGSVWRPVGEVPQGLVLRPIDGIFTIEGRQVHEAYLVVKENNLVGFYLAGESHFSPLKPSQPILLEKINE